ncbi:hypothetical protein [Vibrio hippocampi]|uniref:Chromosome partitioning protein ParA n=1 Tax=Vibrio hippocampi TaxID=654686 RepID=A0ABN8DM51_9VIBR|nr:hypothetical protein [Vibrio hippocampi]CAH0529680.1 hypothetical protein VHP8226_03435 [Vibrio hippocampi]
MSCKLFTLNTKAASLVAVLCLSYGSLSSASELINFDEQIALDDINRQYESSYQATGLEQNVSHYNTLSSDIESVKIKLTNSIDIVNTDSLKLKDQLIAGQYDESLVLTLRNMSANIARLKTLLANNETELATLTESIATGQNDVNHLARTKNKQLLSLYEQIKSRHVSSARTVLSDTVTGQIECDVTQSLSACVNSNLTSMKNSFVLGKGGAERIAIDSFKVTDATQKMSGDLSYTVNAKYKRVYNANLEVELRKALGLEKIFFVFRSNTKGTEYYINDQKVGRGEKVQISGNYVGVYDVKAVKGGKTQSLKLNLENDGDYFFPFASQKTTSKTSKQPESKTAENASSLTKQILSGLSIQPNDDELKPANYYSNTVIHKDELYHYLSPVEHKNSGRKTVYLSQQRADQYCQEKLSAQLASKDVYNYLAKSHKLDAGSYWIANGQVYSATTQAIVDSQSKQNRFICMLSMQ